MEDNKKGRGLGKGLSELLGEARAKAALNKQTKIEPIVEKPNNIHTEKQHTINDTDLSKELDSLNDLSDTFDENKKRDEAPEVNATSNYDDDDNTYEDTDDNFETIDLNDDDAFETVVSSKEKMNIQSNIDSEVITNNSEKAHKKPEIITQESKIVTTNRHENIIHKLPIELVNPNKEQPRKFFDTDNLNDLAASIKIYGVIQPILVNKIDNEYMIVAGERRWRASQIAGLKEIPAIIVNYNEHETLEVALIENIQRANLTPLDEAKSYYYLIHKYELTQNELAQKVGKSRSYVANIVRLLELEDGVKNYLETGELSIGHARVLIGVKNAADLAEKIVKSNMSVRKVEELVSQSVQKQNVRLPKAFNTGKNTDILALEADLRAALGVAVSINSQTNQKGNLVIRYDSLEQLDEVCRRLCSNWGVDVA